MGNNHSEKTSFEQKSIINEDEFDTRNRVTTIPKIFIDSDLSSNNSLAVPQSQQQMSPIKSRKLANNTMTPPSISTLKVLSYYSTSNSTPRSPKTPKSPSPVSPPSYNNIPSINNGITGKYVSAKICEIAASFWKDNIVKLSMSEQLVSFHARKYK